MTGNNASKKDERSRNWSILFYPDSCPNWEEIAEDLNIPIAISPLHDRDINKKTGELKKAHYHAVLMFSSNKSEKQIQEISDKFSGKIPEAVRDIRGTIRYLAHLDSGKNKALYNAEDITVFGGINILPYLKGTKDELRTERHNALKEMTEYIVKNKVIEFSDFYFYCMENNFEWFKLLSDNSAFIIDKVITSLRHKIERDARL